jgi:hypothetical protein
MAWNGSLEDWGRNAWGLEGVEENYFNLTIPKRRVSFVTETSSGVFNLKKPKIVFNINHASSFNLTIPHRVFALTDASNGVFNLSIPKRVFSLQQAGLLNGTFGLTIPKRRIRLVEGIPNSGVFNLTIPHRIFEFSGASSTSGVFTIHVPKRRFNLTDRATAGTGGITESTPDWTPDFYTDTLTLVMNTDTLDSPVTYSNWDWNSIIQINGITYVCDSTGLYQVGGTLDKGTTHISSYFVIPDTDLGSPSLKTVTDIYLGVKGGPVGVKTFHDETYSLPDSAFSTSGEIKTKRLSFSKGMKQRYWGVRVENVDGSDFKIDSLELSGNSFIRKINQR